MVVPHIESSPASMSWNRETKEFADFLQHGGQDDVRLLGGLGVDVLRILVESTPIAQVPSAPMQASNRPSPEPPAT